MKFGGPNTTAWVNGREITKNGYFRVIVCWDVRNLLKAGVRVYSEGGDPVEANEALVCLHARTQGRKTITIPCAADVDNVFGGKPVARGLRPSPSTPRSIPPGSSALAGEFSRECSLLWMTN